ncbi:MAG: radical SAM protein [Firmicutes bacterium]|nr:radical SAM protein [Bacillota bacterium]
MIKRTPPEQIKYFSQTDESCILPRFRARREFFGSLVLDCREKSVLPFDAISTAILESFGEYSLPQIKAAFAPYIPEKDMEDFVSQWHDYGMIDDDFRFGGVFFPDRSRGEYLSAPLRIYLDLTAGCNLRCRHCVSSSTVAAKNELTDEEIRELFEELAFLGVSELNIGGGEPLMRKGACDLLQYASSLGLSVSINTNGTLIDEKMAKDLASVNFDKFNISMEGGTEEIHDFCRGKGSFRKTLGAVEILSAHTPHRINLDFTITKHNAAHLKSFFDLTQKLPVSSMCLGIIRPQGRAAQNTELLLTSDEQKDILNRIEALKSGFEKPVWSKILMPECSDEPSGRLYKTFGCGAAQVACQIDAEGYMSPCNFFDEADYRDNIREKTVNEIWHENRFFIKLRNLQGNSKCLNCKFHNHCRGGCRAQALYHYGDLNSPDFLCFCEE